MIKIKWRNQNKLSEDQARLLVHDYNRTDMTVSQICEKYDITPRTFYKYLRAAEGEVGKR